MTRKPRARRARPAPAGSTGHAASTAASKPPRSTRAGAARLLGRADRHDDVPGRVRRGVGARPVRPRAFGRAGGGRRRRRLRGVAGRRPRAGARSGGGPGEPRPPDLARGVLVERQRPDLLDRIRVEPQIGDHLVGRNRLAVAHDPLDECVLVVVVVQLGDPQPGHAAARDVARGTRLRGVEAMDLRARPGRRPVARLVPAQHVGGAQHAPGAKPVNRRSTLSDLPSPSVSPKTGGGPTTCSNDTPETTSTLSM